MKPQLFLDRRSPPVRSVLLLIEALKIDVDENHIDLFKGDHLNDNYLKVNEKRRNKSVLTKKSVQ